MHHMAKMRFQDLFTQEVQVFKNKNKLKPLTGYPLKFTYTFYLTGKMLDVLNTGGMAKAFEDALRYNGLLEDDSLKYVCDVRLLERKSERGYNYCTIEWEKEWEKYYAKH